MSGVADWLAAARVDADRPPKRERLPLHIDGVVCGSLEPALGARLVDARQPLRRDGEGWHLEGAADASLAAIAAWLQSAGLAGAWRNELLVVETGPGRADAAIERAAVRPLGITTFAVHLIGVTSDGRVWVQRRAFDKATDPGLRDTLMGGQVAAGETAATALERETMEEAGLAIATLDDVHGAGRITVRRPVDEGYLVEHIDVFVATVPDGVEPRNLDGEVADFDCLDVAALEAVLQNGEFTLEATLILGAWLEGRAGAEVQAAAVGDRA